MLKTQLQTKKSDKSACRAKCKPMCRSYRGHWFWLKKASGQPARWDDFLLCPTFVFHTLQYVCLIDVSVQDAKISFFSGNWRILAWLWDVALETFVNKLIMHLVVFWLCFGCVRMRDTVQMKCISDSDVPAWSHLYVKCGSSSCRTRFTNRIRKRRLWIS